MTSLNSQLSYPSIYTYEKHSHGEFILNQTPEKRCSLMLNASIHIKYSDTTLSLKTILVELLNWTDHVRTNVNSQSHQDYLLDDIFRHDITEIYQLLVKLMDEQPEVQYLIAKKNYLFTLFDSAHLNRIHSFMLEEALLELMSKLPRAAD